MQKCSYDMIQYMKNEKNKEIFIHLSIAGGINLVCFSVKNVNICLHFLSFINNGFRKGFLLSWFRLTFVVLCSVLRGLAYKYVCTILHDIFSSSYPY